MTYTETICMTEESSMTRRFVRLDPLCTNNTRTDLVAYTLAAHPAKAMKAYEKAHAWRELFTVAKEQQLDSQAITGMVERVTGQPSFISDVGACADTSDHLTGRGKSLDAAQVHMEYAEDVDSAVDALTRGAEFAEAYRIVSHLILRVK